NAIQRPDAACRVAAPVKPLAHQTEPCFLRLIHVAHGERPQAAIGGGCELDAHPPVQRLARHQLWVPGGQAPPEAEASAATRGTILHLAPPTRRWPPNRRTARCARDPGSGLAQPRPSTPFAAAWPPCD